ncbi:hypothetical protein BMETH_1984_0 [methanotrophic bacterial endosymbiont of Bathymodiolus sp.]|nr:hypothetical protein BMETH_1984_0 [methanotrophic bacterial endosymbiont of Bathymodiolus sp.]
MPTLLLQFEVKASKALMARWYATPTKRNGAFSTIQKSLIREGLTLHSPMSWAITWFTAIPSRQIELSVASVTCLMKITGN